MSATFSDDERVERLLRRTLELVDTASVSGNEAEILRRLRAMLPTDRLHVVDDRDSVLMVAASTRRPETPFVIVAGHVDTVPHNGNHPGRRDGDAIVGRGAADMKGALAVMVELAELLADDPHAFDVDVAWLFFGREELPIVESALLPFLERCPDARAGDLAIVMEPTANAIEVGCLGNLTARVTVHGRAAHAARPWLGRNAIHAAIAALAPIAERPTLDVEIDGLTYREVMSVTGFEGGIAANVVPDRVEARVNFRYAPNRSPAVAEALLRDAISHGDADVEVIGNAPPGAVAVHNPLVGRLRRAGGLPVGPKQAWTPVAEFAAVGVDAINFGPGDPEYAHRDDERVDAPALVRSFEVLRGFLAAREGS